MNEPEPITSPTRPMPPYYCERHTRYYVTLTVKGRQVSACPTCLAEAWAPKSRPVDETPESEVTA